MFPVNNLPHHFCLSGFPFCSLPSVFSAFPSWNSCYWYLKLMVMVNVAAVLVFCNYPCPVCGPLEIPLFIVTLLHKLWKVPTIVTSF